MKYTIEIFYSEEDGGYIAVVPELPGCSAFGVTLEEALKRLKLPSNSGLKLLRKKVEKFLSRWVKSC